MSVLVISNAGAARARRGVAALRQTLPESREVNHVVTERPEELYALVGHDRWLRDDLLIINGGDGSVQHALTALLAHCPPDRQPRMACLPGGTTNMTAFDLNRHRRFRDCVESLRRAVSPSGVASEPRSVVRVRGPRTGELPQCGLFFGIGTIVQGIEYFQSSIRRRGGGHELGAGAALVRTLWGIARRQPPFSEALTVEVNAPFLLPGRDRMRAESAPGEPRSPGIALTGCDGSVTVSARLLLATTLDRLFLGMRPYWGTGPGALKATLVESRANAFVARVPRLLRGRPDETMSPHLGYHSARLDALALTFSGAYTLDGELFATSGDTIEVRATEPVRFLPL